MNLEIIDIGQREYDFINYIKSKEKFTQKQTAHDLNFSQSEIANFIYKNEKYINFMLRKHEGKGRPEKIYDFNFDLYKKDIIEKLNQKIKDVNSIISEIN